MNTNGVAANVFSLSMLAVMTSGFSGSFAGPLNVRSLSETKRDDSSPEARMGEEVESSSAL